MIRTIAPGWIVLAVVSSGSLLTGCNAGRSAMTMQPAGGKPEVIEQYWPNGKLRLRQEVLRQPDGTAVEHGTCTSWYDHGGKEYEAVYVHGRVDGVVRTWHRNGLKATEQYFVAGQRQGPRYSWDDNGILRKEEHFDHDQPVGTWTTWDAHGKIEAQHRFEGGARGP